MSESLNMRVTRSQSELSAVTVPLTQNESQKEIVTKPRNELFTSIVPSGLNEPKAWNVS